MKYANQGGKKKMNSTIRRIYVEKKQGFNVESQHLLYDLQSHLRMPHLVNVRLLNRYDISNVALDDYEKAKTTIFSEPTVDVIFEEELSLAENEAVFAVEYLPGQYDQRADSAMQCVQILTQEQGCVVSYAKVVVLCGELTSDEIDAIKKYIINPVDSREAALEKPETLDVEYSVPDDVEIIEGFIDRTREELEAFMSEMNFAMNLDDLVFIQSYFRDTKKRNPFITELKVLDTYWSDHCRHTTFLTEISNVEFEEGHFTTPIKKTYDAYLQSRNDVYGDREKAICLMDMATLAMKELRKNGQLEDLDVSEEINACSIVVTAEIDGKEEEWLVMFKNETHNHPTEIEPFGGAATCLGGAIRDPLSGRSYVYQAMRVTGSADPRTPLEDTLPGKLPQRQITTGAAHGYSSYGNQIGLATGLVHEVYDEDYVAKRMEIGAVIAAAPKENVVRHVPEPGDIIILLGGRTGRDGCGGATGSSKEHTEESIHTCGAEVQKGNPPTERKIQRLFRNPKVSQMIKRCNDFGAGGVCVAIGELAEGLSINLDAVPKKYEGLDGTELAISESQERMAVVVNKEDVDAFIKYSLEENLESSVVAVVTEEPVLKMTWRGNVIVDLDRSFVDTNGVRQTTTAYISAPETEKSFFNTIQEEKVSKASDLKEAWIANLEQLNVCSQRGLIERFDSTIGAGTVLMPFGGKYQRTPAETMVAKLPVGSRETTTATMMSYGYNARLSKWSPFHGALYAVVESVSKIVANGGKFDNIRLTFQEYFEKLGKDAARWGKPTAALLGAFHAQSQLGIPAIGGKDSMSGTFGDINVPPTLVSFAVDVVNANNVISGEFKGANHTVAYLPIPKDEFELPIFDQLKEYYNTITKLIHQGKISSAYTVKAGGVSEAVSKMAFGNGIGLQFTKEMSNEELFAPHYGSFVVEFAHGVNVEKELASLTYTVLGTTTTEAAIIVNGVTLELEALQKPWENTLEDIFPTLTKDKEEEVPTISYNQRSTAAPSIKTAKPRIFMPIFPGTNCEYDTQRAFEKAGGVVEPFVFKNLNPQDIKESVDSMVKMIQNAQIIMFPGGFSAGDEPDGSGKFIATVFRNPKIKEEVMKFLKERDGLMLGICNGFQALIKLGLVPFGEIRDLDEDCPTLTYNTIGRHISCMAQTKITSTLSPWFNNVNVGDMHTIPLSHGEGRFVANEKMMQQLIANGQIATQYVDFDGNPTHNVAWNPNGSVHAIEGITSPDGRILGKMGHSERVGNHVAKNVPGQKDQKLFEAGVRYFL